MTRFRVSSLCSLLHQENGWSTRQLEQPQLQPSQPRPRISLSPAMLAATAVLLLLYRCRIQTSLVHENCIYLWSTWRRRSPSNLHTRSSFILFRPSIMPSHSRSIDVSYFVSAMSIFFLYPRVHTKPASYHLTFLPRIILETSIDSTSLEQGWFTNSDRRKDCFHLHLIQTEQSIFLMNGTDTSFVVKQQRLTSLKLNKFGNKETTVRISHSSTDELIIVSTISIVDSLKIYDTNTNIQLRLEYSFHFWRSLWMMNHLWCISET